MQFSTTTSSARQTTKRQTHVLGLPLELTIACLLAGAAVAYLLWYVITYAAYPADDTFIHMRIARHFVEYGLPYYNPDQAVAGSSSVLWLLLLSGTFALLGPNPEVVLAINATFTVGIFVALLVLFAQRYKLCVAVGIAFLLCVLSVVNVSALLMETPLALLFFVLSLLSLRRQSFTLTGLLGGLAFATRYEFAVWLILLLLASPGIRPRVRIVMGGSIPVALVIAFNLYFFESLIPNTIRAKSVIYDLAITDSLLSAGISIPLTQLILPAVLHVLLATLLLRRFGDRLSFLTLLFGGVLLGLYLVRSTLVFPWYTPLFLLPLLVGYSLSFVWRSLPLQIAALACAVICAGGPAAKALEDGRGLVFDEPIRYRDYGLGLRARQYLNIGRALRQRFPNASLMTSEVGAIGWTFGGQIIDAAGLVSPECLHYHPMPVPEERSTRWLAAIPPRAVRDLQPDLIVAIEVFSEAVRRDMQEGRIVNYELLASYPIFDPQEFPNTERYKLWNSEWTQVFVRTGAAHQLQ